VCASKWHVLGNFSPNYIGKVTLWNRVRCGLSNLKFRKPFVFGKFFSLPQHLFLHPNIFWNILILPLSYSSVFYYFLLCHFITFPVNYTLPKHCSDKLFFLSNMVILLEHFKKLYRFISLQSQLKYSTGTLFTSVPVWKNLRIQNDRIDTGTLFKVYRYS
jgi:hypothetical protein